MKIWFEAEGKTLIAQDGEGGYHVLPVLDANGKQHLVRWGADRHDHQGFPRGMWYRKGPLAGWGATWVRIPASKYEQQTMYGSLLGVPLDVYLAGALIRVPGEGVRVYLVESESPGKTTVVPMLFRDVVGNTV